MFNRRHRRLSLLVGSALVATMAVAAPALASSADPEGPGVCVKVDDRYVCVLT
jgi:hypothetical protein